jgi:hypothetical protein
MVKRHALNLLPPVTGVKALAELGVACTMATFIIHSGLSTDEKIFCISMIYAWIIHLDGRVGLSVGIATLIAASSLSVLDKSDGSDTFVVIAFYSLCVGVVGLIRGPRIVVMKESERQKAHDEYVARYSQLKTIYNPRPAVLKPRPMAATAARGPSMDVVKRAIVIERAPITIKESVRLTAKKPRTPKKIQL